MKILKVIHGYPMLYNAGSEVYSQSLCQSLAARHELHVFTREEVSIAPDFRLRTETDLDDPRITLHIVNNPRLRDRYRSEAIDQRFVEVLERLQPDIVHIGHLNHLSTSIVREAASRRVPIVMTLHDYWLLCPRGQLLQMFPVDPSETWALCDGQEDRKCAERCYSRYFSGAPEERDSDLAYWTDWVGRRMKHVREMAELVDLFIAPARDLRDRFVKDFGLPASKIEVLDYGFDLSRFSGRQRAAGEPLTFGYIGTHTPAKGIQDLIQAFGQLQGEARLRIWGRHRGQDTAALQSLGLAQSCADRIEWLNEYRNQDITREVFDRCDAIVVPSIWLENSPLVIHEAQQARLPVITARAGGMAEFVKHEVNGLLFEHRSVSSLAEQMQRFVDDQSLVARLGARGYLDSASGDIPSMDIHAQAVEKLYDRVRQRQQSADVAFSEGPWRITFDTNPDTCNLRCIMCEDHSPFSDTQPRRIAEGRARRLMPFELIERVVREAAPKGLREIIPSTMGEPLLYEHFLKILDLCRETGVLLNLTTNGTFPKLGATEWARLIAPVTSDVKISWNGASKATHEAIMLGSNWEDVLEKARQFISVRDQLAAQGGHRCRVTFQATFLESNVQELPDLVRLAISLGVDRVKGHHLWAHFKEIEGQSMRRSPESIARWNQAVLDSRAIVASNPLPNGQRLLLENFFLLDASASEDLAPGGPCPFLGQEAWINASGRFDPCCAPDAQRRSLGDFGNLQEQSFLEIWNGSNYQSLMANYRNRKLCLSCNMRKPVEEV